MSELRTGVVTMEGADIGPENPLPPPAWAEFRMAEQAERR